MVKLNSSTKVSYFNNRRVRIRKYNPENHSKIITKARRGKRRQMGRRL